ncbi:hypothetical protein [Georgenia sp. MJ170]|uniref:hypothetical protein n=1 Tax=Georgenia sunbinii TaxID=3117728 RepID=UPI002F26852C
MSTPSSHDPQQPAEPDESGQQAPSTPEPSPTRSALEDTGTITSPYDEPGGDEPGDVEPATGPATVDGTRPVAEPVTEPVTAPAAPPVATETPATTSATTPQDLTATDGPTTTSADTAARQHRIERPVPRSGLAEHASAGYLTGDREPAHGPVHDLPPEPLTDPAPTAALPGWTSEPPVTERLDVSRATDDEPDTAVVLEGATIEPTLRSRAGAHWLGVLVAIVLLPVAWYLTADAGARLTLPAGSPWQTGNLNVAALLELGGGLVVLAVALLAARWSSVGSIVVGSLVIVLGVPFVAVPQWTQEFLAPALEWLRDFNDLGGNVAHHLVATGSSGRFVVYGVALVLLGVVSHGARRQGRREALARARAVRD